MLYLHNLFDASYYYLNPYALVLFMLSGLAIIFGFYVYYVLKEKPVIARQFFYVFLSGFIWFWGLGMMLSASPYGVALFWLYFLSIGAILIPSSVFLTTVILADREKEQRFVDMLLSCFVILLAILSASPYLHKDVVQVAFGFYPLGGDLPVAILSFSLFCSVGSFMNLAHGYRHQHDPAYKKQFVWYVLAIGCLSWGFVRVFLSYYDFYFPMDGLVAVFAFFILCGFITMQFSRKILLQRAEKLENEIVQKTLEISQVVKELRATQLKIFETGRISALASLSAGILHQISQPITAIHGFLKFMKKEMDSTHKFYKPVCLMEEQSVYLKSMLEDLMELIRHRKIKKEETDINNCVKRATTLLTDELRIRRVNWDLVLGENIPRLHADGIHLQQVFMNVMINALEAMSTLPRGSARYLKIETRYDKAQNEIQVSFQDTGPGLSVEDKNQIFEPFFSTKTQGTGIGLALCKDLVAEHGGTIDVVSEEGKGAKFIISLPCTAVTNTS